MIQRRLQDPLAQLILEGKIADGAKVKVSASKTGLTINGQEFAAAADELADTAPAGMASEIISRRLRISVSLMRRAGFKREHWRAM